MASILHIGIIMARKNQKLTALAVLKQAVEPIGISVLVNKLGGVPQRTLRRWVNDWVDEGFIEKVGQGRATRYCSNIKQSDHTKELIFFNGLDNDLRVSLLSQLRDLWTYNSTAIEGNTLTLGDTHLNFVIDALANGRCIRRF